MGTKAEPEGREQWGRQLEFIFTLIGYAVGLGNIWRFPYLCYKNGGGAFLIPYVICLIFLGIPIFALEVSFGQYGGKGPISIWYINPALKGIGYAGTLVSTIVCIYYDVIIAWGLYYLFASMTDEVPWSKCSSCSCLTYGDVNATLGYDNVTGLNCTGWDGTVQSPSEVYYKDVVLEDTGSIAEAGEVNWRIMLCNLLSWLIVLVVLSKGIKSLGKVVYFTATFPYIFLTVLLIRVALLDGALEGIEYYLTPDWDRLTDATVWSDAAVQIFFSLSACQGGLIAMASYNKFSNNVLRDSLLVPIINCLTSFYAGFVVFSTLGYMAHIRDVSVPNVTASGPGLAFIVYPEAVSNMPITPLWAILFFFMLCTLGFSSQFSIVETVMTAVIDEFPHLLRTTKSRFLFRGFICLSAFALGLPMVTQGGSYMLDLADTYVLGFPTLFVALFELIAICYVYGYKNFNDDVEAMIGRRPFIYLRVCWVVISPILILAVIIFKAIQYEPITSKGDPVWAEVVGWFISMAPVAVVPLYFFWYTCPAGLWGNLRELNTPEKGWRLRRNKSKNERLHVDNMRHRSYHFGMGEGGPVEETAYGNQNSGFEPDMKEKTHGITNKGFESDEKSVGLRTVSFEGQNGSTIKPESGYVPYSVDPSQYLAEYAPSGGNNEMSTHL